MPAPPARAAALARTDNLASLCNWCQRKARNVRWCNDTRVSRASPLSAQESKLPSIQELSLGPTQQFAMPQPRKSLRDSCPLPFGFFVCQRWRLAIVHLSAGVNPQAMKSERIGRGLADFSGGTDGPQPLTATNAARIAALPFRNFVPFRCATLVQVSANRNAPFNEGMARCTGMKRFALH